VKAKDYSNTVSSIARIPIPTVNPYEHVFKIAELMANNDVGSVIVTRDAEPIGMVTEKDLVRKIIYANRNAKEVVAQEIMTSPLITISSGRTIDEALKIMQDNAVRRLVVLKGERMVGLLTERRLLRAKLDSF